MICERGVAPRRALIRAAAAALCVVVAVGPAVAGKSERTRGVVDGDAFLELAGEDNLRIEVSIPSSLLKPVIRGLDEEARKLLGGIESIHAIIIDLEGVDRVDELRALIRSTGKRLQGQGWERLARVREEDTEVTVLVLNDEIYILGLVVMVVDNDENQLVFANVAGQLDLAAIEGIQDAFGVPGLDDIDFSDARDD